MMDLVPREHIDFAAIVWTVPKTKKIDGHRVRLSNAAISVLRKMKSDDEGDTLFFFGCDGRGDTAAD
jgi:hypothetical protein